MLPKVFFEPTSKAVTVSGPKPSGTAKTGDSVVFSFGATGGLYTQISQGAPFEVFFSADNKRPTQAVTEGFAIDGTVFTYAVGRLALYSPMLDLTDGPAVLAAGDFQHIAIADPATNAGTILAMAARCERVTLMVAGIGMPVKRGPA